MGEIGEVGMEVGGVCGFGGFCGCEGVFGCGGFCEFEGGVEGVVWDGRVDGVFVVFIISLVDWRMEGVNFVNGFYDCR